MIIKKIAFFSLLITVAAICTPISSFPQSTSGGTGVVSPGGGSQSPDVLQGQPDFPDYIVAPRDSLNPFGLSTMSGSKDVDYRDGVGTLGTATKRASNVEVNKTIERVPEVEDADTSDQGAEDSFIQADVVNQPPRSTSRKHENIYTWTDEEGVLHVTNDLGTVPPKYQEQALKESSTRQD